LNAKPLLSGYFDDGEGDGMIIFIFLKNTISWNETLFSPVEFELHGVTPLYIHRFQSLRPNKLVKK
jgi:hypothetical protein